MKSSHALNLFMNPFWMWSRQSWKIGEMALAAAQVIGLRTARMARAGALPSASDQHEFSLMSREKAEAVIESAQAMGMPLLLLNQQFASLAFKQMLSGSIALMTLASSRSPAESAVRQSRLLRTAITDSAVAASKLSGSAARIARRGLIPVQKRVSGNARRLSQR